MAENFYKPMGGLSLEPTDPASVVGPTKGDIIRDKTDSNAVKIYDGTSWTVLKAIPGDTVGDMILFGDSGTHIKLPVGNDGEILTVDKTSPDKVIWKKLPNLDAKKLEEFADSAAYEVEYGTPTGGEIFYDSTEGVIYTYNAVKSKWMQSGAAAILENKGDIVTYDGVDIAKLGVGNDGEVLTADSASPEGLKWSPGGGGTRADTTVTVGSGGDYATINEALEYLSEYYPLYKKSGFTAEINLLSGFVMEEQVIVVGIDLGWITITAVDAEVNVDKAYVTQKDVDELLDPAAFCACRGATLPVIGALFKYSVKAESDHSGILAVQNSRANILPNCGFKNAGRYGIAALYASSINADNANASGSGFNGIAASRGSTINADNANASGAVESGVAAYLGSTINARRADISGAGRSGVRSVQSSTIDASGANASGAGSDYGLFVGTGSFIDAEDSIGTLNQAARTLTARGIIFK